MRSGDFRVCAMVHKILNETLLFSEVRRGRPQKIQAKLETFLEGVEVGPFKKWVIGKEWRND